MSVALRRYDFALGELANGRPAAAVTALKQALALDRKLVPAYDALGVALKDLGRFDEAEEAYLEAVRLDATYAAAYHNLGELLEERGRLDEARHYFDGALRANPALNQCRIRLGNVLVELGELEAAVDCYKEAAAHSPNPAGIHVDLGLALWKLGDSAEALNAFQHAVAGNPLPAETHYNLGTVLLESGRFDEAVKSARDALKLRPGFPEARVLCAAGLVATGAFAAGVELLRGSGDREVSAHQRWLILATRLMSVRLFEPARCCLDRALQEEPGDVMALHLLTASAGENPDHPIDGYVRRLFDISAATFDLDLVSKLGYRIPRDLVRALRAVQNAPASPWNVLDLGCGTGLVGVEIAPYSRRLAGIDLAANMIERARRRNIYTDLHCADLMAVLERESAQHSRYDVVTAADVFIYVGKLDAVIPAIRGVLSPGGLFAFSAEAAEVLEGSSPDGYRLGVMGRYAHSADYLQRLARESGFAIELLREERIRFEHRRPVQGWLTVWRAA